MKHFVLPTLLIMLLLAGCGSDDTSDSATSDANTNGSSGKADIIGEDDRRDLFSFEEDSLPRTLARSTAMLMSRGQIAIEGDTATITNLPRLGLAKNLCDDQPFVDQPATGFCTAFLVAPDVVVTAGHCISERECSTTSFLFDFGYTQQPENPIEALRELPADNVYGCQEFLFARNPSACGDPDILVIRLDRAVDPEKRPPLTYRRQGQIEPDTDIFMIGHPDGLPTKVATGQSRDPVDTILFKDNLDSFGGNSGSPVFNQETGVVEGVRSCSSGEHSQPSLEDPSCNVLYQCPEDGSGCDIVLGTTYNISDAAFAIDAILGLEPLPDENDNPDMTTFDCCSSHEAPGCEDEAIAMCVCTDDDFCCNGMWDGGCVAKIEQLGCGICPE